MLEKLKADISMLVAMYEKERLKAESLSRILADREAELENYKAEVRKCKEQITGLNLQIDNLRLGKAFAGKGEGAVDGIIKEIDECIRLLEN
ncbi:MAG TPA: hypothetical protein IAC35_07380 [Candidatus Cryptobacteroides merdipullorum]|uniref:Uncharacterized protein n=1 Tax=Candidatus Cryptobacteroides merdipullorum TaxID=2840771 RepID=A0A9D1GPS2_9BACT|nr:hypothetical protein [Candidatus Cryptobacteroides merdipullorum]